MADGSPFVVFSVHLQLNVFASSVRERKHNNHVDPLLRHAGIERFQLKTETLSDKSLMMQVIIMC